MTAGWVAVSPRERGRRLGYLVCLTVLHYAASSGHQELFLRTDDDRLRAIRTYVKLGFQPWLRDGAAASRWEAALRTMRTPRSWPGGPTLA